MASMRNRLVHLYSEVDDEIVFDAIVTAPVDCERFVQLVFEYLYPPDNDLTERS